MAANCGVFNPLRFHGSTYWIAPQRDKRCARPVSRRAALTVFTAMASLRLADDHHQALTAGDGSIQEIAFEHRVVLGGQGHDHGRELRALALVERLGMRSATDSMSLSWIASGKEAGRK